MGSFLGDTSSDLTGEQQETNMKACLEEKHYLSRSENCLKELLAKAEAIY